MSVCSRCAATFTCGMTDDPDGVAPCWCTQLPLLPRDAYDVDGGGCLCPQCLRKLISQATPHPAPGQ